ncbi:MAG: WD40/YVTN/BNR-like repeat-containing protein [Acidimicrobiia bacterium]
MLVVVIAARGGGGGGGGRASNGPLVGGDLHTLVVDATQAQRLYVGGHQAAAVSSDGGRTWAEVPSLRNADGMGWAFVGDAVWMGGHPGLRRSTDGGRSFEPAGGELASNDVHALGGAGSVLYAASPSRGLLASTDGGRSWQVRSSSAGRAFMGAIVVDRRDPEHLFAPDMQAGVVESRDGGRSWRRLASPGMAMSVTAVGGSADKLVMAGNGAAARSSDGGATWQPLDVPKGTMAVAGAEDGTLYAAALEGNVARVSRSADGGASWQLLNP